MSNALRPLQLSENAVWWTAVGLRVTTLTPSAIPGRWHVTHADVTAGVEDATIDPVDEAGLREYLTHFGVGGPLVLWRSEPCVAKLRAAAS